MGQNFNLGRAHKPNFFFCHQPFSMFCLLPLSFLLCWALLLWLSFALHVVSGFREKLNVKAGVHLKAVFQLGIKLLMQISRLRFKQSRISMLISHIYVLGRCVIFLVIFRYIWR